MPDDALPAAIYYLLPVTRKEMGSIRSGGESTAHSLPVAACKSDRSTRCGRRLRFGRQYLRWNRFLISLSSRSGVKKTHFFSSSFFALVRILVVHFYGENDSRAERAGSSVSHSVSISE
ncbi:hypothetical protein GQ55_2G011700 [Panicum hallii var. hallii]|uniref:Uncharacterized protein n=1 Tax=Panicum hallii var. hallii TaxID=1504633 RepID=A0A2T7EKA9_9POAL|nr:hypothetical protein GQ55_2G011700 [Panicum hallii var. hallii]